MNKKEIATLASIVLEMIDSSDSTPQVISYGKSILSQFPSLSEAVGMYRSIEHMTNIKGLIVAYLGGCYGGDTMLALKKITPKQRIAARDKIFGMLDTIVFCWDDTCVEDLMNKLFDSIDGYGDHFMIEFITDTKWTTLASEHFDSSSVEFKYLTGTLVV